MGKTEVVLETTLMVRCPRTFSPTRLRVALIRGQECLRHSKITSGTYYEQFIHVPPAL